MLMNQMVSEITILLIVFRLRNQIFQSSKVKLNEFSKNYQRTLLKNFATLKSHP